MAFAVLAWPTSARAARARPTAVCAACRPSSGAAVFAAAAAAAALLTVAHPVGAAVISAPECFNGTGAGCDAAESPLIRDLLQKSRANKERNERETLEKYWDGGYKSYFSFGYDLDLTKQADGSYTLERPKSIIGNALRSLGWEPPARAGAPSH